VGEILLWKKAQKKDAKNRTSEAMNRIMPVFSPFMTELECNPWVELSRWMSRHHTNATVSMNASAITITLGVSLFMISRPDSTKQIAPPEASSGHGLISTKWNGFDLFVITLLLWCIG